MFCVLFAPQTQFVLILATFCEFGDFYSPRYFFFGWGLKHWRKSWCCGTERALSKICDPWVSHRGALEEGLGLGISWGKCWFLGSCSWQTPGSDAGNHSLKGHKPSLGSPKQFHWFPLYTLSPAALMMLPIPAGFGCHVDALQPGNDSPDQAWPVAAAGVKCWQPELASLHSLIAFYSICDIKRLKPRRNSVIWFHPAWPESPPLVHSACVCLHCAVYFPVLWWDPAGLSGSWALEKCLSWPLPAPWCWASSVRAAGSEIWREC